MSDFFRVIHSFIDFFYTYYLYIFILYYIKTIVISEKQFVIHWRRKQKTKQLINHSIIAIDQRVIENFIF